MASSPSRFGELRRRRGPLWLKEKPRPSRFRIASDARQIPVQESDGVPNRGNLDCAFNQRDSHFLRNWPKFRGLAAGTKAAAS